MNASNAEDDMPEPTELGRIIGTGTWLHEASLALRQYVSGDPEREIDLRWLVLGLEVSSAHLLKIGIDREAGDPGGELFVGQQSRH